MVDIDGLLAPISEDAPTGSYLKLDRSAYRSLRNSYNTAQSSFRQLIETPDASNDETLLTTNSSNWAELRNITLDALTQSTKDVEILGWYITSQLFTEDPFENLASSSKVLYEFINKFWDTLHPTLPENKIKSSSEEGIAKELVEFRLKPLLQLVGESQDSTALYMPLQLVSLIEDITFADYLRAERNGEIANLKEKAQSLFSNKVENTIKQLSQIYQNFNQVESAITQRCQAIGATAVSFKFIKTNISDLLNALRFLLEEKFTLWPLDENYNVLTSAANSSASNTNSDSQNEQTPQSESSVENITATEEQTKTLVSDNSRKMQQNTVTQSGIAEQITNRDQAFHELRKISNYFKEAEPHSPIYFLLERAIRWGYMSLPELMQEMTANNGNVIQQINQLTGMDHLEQHDLSGKPYVRSPISRSTFEPTAPDVNANMESSVSSDEADNSTPTTPNQPHTESNSQSGNVTDFEW